MTACGAYARVEYGCDNDRIVYRGVLGLVRGSALEVCAVTDPITILEGAVVCAHGEGLVSPADCHTAEDFLAQNARRACIESRLQNLLDSDTDCDVRFRRKNGEYRVALYRYSTNERLGSGASEDLHKAVEKAIDAVGAP